MKKEEKKIYEYIEEWAKGDYEVGHPMDPDDFDEFKHIAIGDNPELSGKHDDYFRKLFDYYYEAFDDARDAEYYDEEDEEE